MLENIFEIILKMSFNATVVALAVILVRFALKRAPKKWSYLLWATVGFRLLCPISFKSFFSIFSLLNFRHAESVVVHETVELPNVSAQIQPTPVTNTVIPPIVTDAVSTGTSAAPSHVADFSPNIMGVLAAIWVLGLAVMLIYGLVSSVKLKSSLANAVRFENNVYFSENINSPFVFGIFSPRIYVPYNLKEFERETVLEHERVHIKRLDHVVKLVSYLLLCVHWFNPIVWISFSLMGKDMEMSCDEKVLSRGNRDSVSYSQTLLSLATQKRFPSPCPIAFGESGIKTRIKNALKWKRPGKIIAFAAPLAVLIILAACSLDPADKKSDDIVGEYELWQVEYSSPGIWVDYTEGEYPSFRVNDLMNLQVKNDVNFPSEDWISLVHLKEAKLTKSDLSDIDPNKFDVDMLVNNNEHAYYGEWGFSEDYLGFMWLLHQNDGTFRLVMGYTAATTDMQTYGVKNISYVFSLTNADVLKWEYNPMLSFTGYSQIVFNADIEKKYTSIEVETDSGELFEEYVYGENSAQILSGNKITVNSEKGFIWSPLSLSDNLSADSAVLRFKIKNEDEILSEGKIQIYALPLKDGELNSVTYAVTMEEEGLNLCLVGENGNAWIYLSDKTKVTEESTEVVSTSQSTTSPPETSEPSSTQPVTEPPQTGTVPEATVEPYTAENLYIKGSSIFTMSENITVEYVENGETVFKGTYIQDEVNKIVYDINFDIPNYMRNSVWKEVAPEDFKFTDNYILYGFDSGAKFCIYNVGWGDIEITDKVGNKYYFTLVKHDRSRSNPWTTAKGEVEELMPFSDANVSWKLQKILLGSETMSFVYVTPGGVYSAETDESFDKYLYRGLYKTDASFKEVPEDDFETSEERITFEFGDNSLVKLRIYNVNGGNLEVTDKFGNKYFFVPDVQPSAKTSFWDLAKTDTQIIESSGKKAVIYEGKTAEEAMLDFASPKTFEAAMNLSDDHPMKITDYAVKEFSDLRVSENGNIMVFQVLYYVKPANFDKYHEAGSTIKYKEDEGQWAYWASHYTSVAMVRIENSNKWEKVFSGGSIELSHVENYYAAY